MKASILLLFFMIIYAGCDQPAGEAEDPQIIEMYRLTLNDGEEIFMYAYTAVEFTPPVFSPPAPVTVTVKNHWNKPTGRLNVRMSGPGRDVFIISPTGINSLAPGASAQIIIGAAKTDPRMPIEYQAELFVGNDTVFQRLPVTYSVFLFEEDK